VRGLAILTVAIFHFSILAGTPHTHPLDNVVSKVIGSGWMGVDLFFVLSGFLITGILYDTKYGQGYFTKFYARRALRIFPVYYGFLLVMLLLITAFSLAGPAIPSFTDDFGWYAMFLGNVHLAYDNAVTLDLPVTAVLWSVAVEEQFYLVWPLIVLALHRRLLIPACLVIIGAALITRAYMASNETSPWFAYTLLPARMDSLAVGALIAIAARQSWGLGPLVRLAPVVGVVALGIVIGLGVDISQMDPFAPRVQAYGYTAIAFMFGAFIVLAVSMPSASPVHWFFASSGMRTIGRYSYAMYVIHYAVGYLIASHVTIAGWFPQVAGSSLLGQAMFVFAALSATFAASWLSWRLVETPFLKLKRYFPYSRPVPEHSIPEPVGAPVLVAGD
jgi:peptidoglycan/LPS O-acetylase OafA/YrhL